MARIQRLNEVKEMTNKSESSLLCDYSLFAMILLSTIVIIYTMIGGILGEAIRRKLQTYFGQRN